MRAAHREALRRRAAPVGIGDCLDAAPDGEAEEPERDRADDGGAEGAAEHRAQRPAAVAGATAGAEGGEHREAADHPVDEAPSTVAEPGEPLEGVAPAEPNHGAGRCALPASAT